jgi:spermidine/putrescine transport system permease protein
MKDISQKNFSSPRGTSDPRQTNPMLSFLSILLRGSPGWRYAVPVLAFLMVGFIGPLLIVLAFSFIPPKTFEFTGDWTLDNYRYIFAGSYYKGLLWSLAFGIVTVAILFLSCYPLAFGIAKVFGKWATPFTLVMVLPLFVSENVRLFGWTLILIKGGGILAGTMKFLFGLDPGTLLYEPGTILLGLCYVYLPFMLFPMVLGLSMVPNEQMDAARDLGASWWAVIREIQIPIAMPGFMIGGLLTFILAFGAISEANILGGQKVVVVADDIKKEFTYSQNWPLGSAISIIVIIITGILVLYVLKRVDLDRLLGKRDK